MIGGQRQGADDTGAAVGEPQRARHLADDAHLKRLSRPRPDGIACAAKGVVGSIRGWKMIRHSAVRHSVPVHLQRPEGKIPSRSLPSRARRQGAANSASCLGGSRSLFACVPGEHVHTALKSRNSTSFGRTPRTGLMRTSSNRARHGLSSNGWQPNPRALPC